MHHGSRLEDGWWRSLGPGAAAGGGAASHPGAMNHEPPTMSTRLTRWSGAGVGVGMLMGTEYYFRLINIAFG